MNPQLELADAITARLNAGTFSQDFEATRLWLPRYDTEELATLQVAVAPIGVVEIEELTRTGVIYTYTIGVGIQQQIDPNDDEAFNALAALTIEIERWLRWKAPNQPGQDRWHPPGYYPGEITVPMAPDAEALEQHKWLSVIFCMFRVAP